MDLVILAAGRGTRLRPLTDHTPKTLVELSERPILKHILDSIPDGIESVYIVVNYLSEKIEEYISKRTYSFQIKCIQQDMTMKGTYGALYSVKDLLKDRFIVQNGDDIHQRDYLESLCSEQDQKYIFGTHRGIKPAGYYDLQIDSEGFLKGLVKYSEEKEILFGNGTYCLDSEFFNLPKEEIEGGEYGIPQMLLRNLDKLQVLTKESKKSIFINSHSDLIKAEEELS